MTLLFFVLIMSLKSDYDHMCSYAPSTRCHAACEEWEEVLSLLAPPTDLDHTSPDTLTPKVVDVIPLPSLGNIEAATLVLKGEAQEALGDLHSSLESFKQALLLDVFCEEALERLCDRRSLTPEMESTLMASLPLTTQCTPLEENTLK